MNVRFLSVLAMCAALSLVLPAGCGYLGIAGVIYRIADQDESPSNEPPTASSSVAVGISSSQVVTIRYHLTDPESDPADVAFSFSTDGGSVFQTPVTELEGAGSEGGSDLAASSAGSTHLFLWDASQDVSGYNVSVHFRIAPTDRRTGRVGTAWTSPPFVLFADSAPSVQVFGPSGDSTGRVSIRYMLADPEGHAVDIAAEFSTNNGATWSTAQALSGFGLEGSVGLTSPASGAWHEFLWNSPGDTGPLDHTVLFRITPTDSLSQAVGTAAVTIPFALWNSRTQTEAGAGTAPLSGVDATAVDLNGILYFSDTNGHRVWAFNPTTQTQSVGGSDLNPGQARILAGNGSQGFDFDGILGPTASLDTPRGLAVDGASPPNLYIADSENHRIRKIDGATGYIATVCGTGTSGTADDLPAFQGQLDTPEDVSLDIYGNLYIADTGNHAIRVVNFSTSSLAVADSTVAPGRVLAVAGQLGSSGFSGDGAVASGSSLDSPCALAVHTGKFIFICDRGNDRIRVINLSTGLSILGSLNLGAQSIETLAGGGAQTPGAASIGPRTADLGTLSGLTLHGTDRLFFLDEANDAVGYINTSSTTAFIGALTIPPDSLAVVSGTWGSSGYAGDGGAFGTALLDKPRHPSMTPSGLLVLADADNRAVRLLNPNYTGGPVLSFHSKTVAAGNVDTAFTPDHYPIEEPGGLDVFGSDVLVTDRSGHRLLRVSGTTGLTSLIAGSGTAGLVDGAASQAAFQRPEDVVTDGSGVVFFVADAQNDRIRIVNTGGSLTQFGITVASGDVGTVPTGANLSNPCGVALNKPLRNTNLFVADTGNHRIVQVARLDGSVTAFAGTGTAGYTDGPLASAQFDSPRGLTMDSNAQIFFVADTGNHAVRVINLTGAQLVFGFGTTVTINSGEVGTLAGLGPASGGYDGDGVLAWSTRLNGPEKIAVDSFLSVTVSDTGNHRIRRIDRSSGKISTLLGTGTGGFNGDGVPHAFTWINSPRGLAFGVGTQLHFCDSLNSRVRVFLP